MLLAGSGAAGNHRSCAVPETRKANHRDVDEQEQHKSQRDKEVNCASGLAATEQSNGPGKSGGKGEGHRQATPDDQGEQNDDHEEVREALEHVVGRGLCLTRPLKAQGFSEGGQERAPRKAGFRPVERSAADRLLELASQQSG